MIGDGPSAARPPVLGRDPLLARVDALLADCRAGRGGLLWLHGEAGIGKTRVLSEIGDRAAGGDGLVLRGTAWEDPGTPSFWVWSQVLRGAAAVLPADEWGERGQPARALLGGRVETVDAVGRFPLFDAVAGVLDLLARERMLVLLLDDVHWMDEGSLRLLRFLASDLASRPVLVACGWRDHDVGATSDQRSLADDLAARAESWLLTGLGEADVSALIALTTGRDVDSTEARAVAARTGGNPLFVSEMARLAQAHGSGSAAGLLPSTAQATIRRRVSRLAGPAESALGVAAVLGASLSVSRLARVLGVSPAALAPLVDDLVGAGLVTQDADRLDFAHALVRDAVYDALAPARRRELHRTVARLLEEDGVVGPQAGELAHHLARAVPLVDGDAVVVASVDAARAAVSVQAYEEAVRWCDRALEVAEPASTRRADLLLLAGESRLSAGDVDGAREAYLEAAELGRSAHDGDYFARAALGFATGLSGFEVRLFDRVQTDLLEEALVRLGPEDSGSRARVLARLSVALSFSASADRRRELAVEAVTMARRLGEPLALAGALAAHCDAISGPAYVELRESEAGEIIGLARGRDAGLELLGLRLRVIARWERGAVDAAKHDVEEFDRLAERLRQPFYSWYSVLWRGLRAHLDGDLDLMAECATEVGRLGELGGSRNAAVLCVVQGAWPFIERGRTGEALARMLAAFGGMPELAGDGGSLVRLFHGQPAEVHAAALRLLPQMLESLPVDKEWLPNLAAVAEGLRESEVDGPPARLLYDTLRPWGHLFLVDGIGAAMSGSVHRMLGELATLLGEHAEAAGHFERALEGNRAIGAPLAVANVQRGYAALLARRDGPNDAERRRGLLEDALAFYRQAGIGERVAEVDALLGGEAPGGAGPAPTAETGVFRPAGEFWTVAWRGREAVLPAVKGMADLAVLLEHPDRETHVLDLVGATSVPRGDLGEVIDETARAAYRTRLSDLDERLEQAEAAGDADASEAAAREREFLLAELGAAYGLGGRARRAGDPAERARTTVTSRIRDAIRRIEAQLPELGRHLRTAVRTGTYCSYAPETPTSWETRPTT